VNVAGIVVVHETRPELTASLRALEPQVDELVVISNLGRELDVPGRLIRNERPLGYAANANRGVRETTAPFVVVANPDVEPAGDAVATLTAFAEAHRRCGIAGPQMRYPDGEWQPSRRRFPTVGGTLVRRTPLRLLVDPYKHQHRHYNLDERPSEPARSDWMLGGFLLLRRTMLDELGGFDEGFRLYGEDVDLCYRAARAGWERWYVPAAVVTHRHVAVTDRRFFTRRTLWHWRGIARFVRKHPERLRSL
jgi:N-acetylglucosaminyl-diphospho-decaprenol L-rhamnosyltransferase